MFSYLVFVQTLNSELQEERGSHCSNELSLYTLESKNIYLKILRTTMKKFKAESVTKVNLHAFMYLHHRFGLMQPPRYLTLLE